jgi:hypothetical protein
MDCHKKERRRDALVEHFDEVELKVRIIIVRRRAHEAQARSLARTSSIVRASIARKAPTDINIQNQRLRPKELLHVARS